MLVEAACALRTPERGTQSPGLRAVSSLGGWGVCVLGLDDRAVLLSGLRVLRLLLRSRWK